MEDADQVYADSPACERGKGSRRAP